MNQVCPTFVGFVGVRHTNPARRRLVPAGSQEGKRQGRACTVPSALTSTWPAAPQSAAVCDAAGPSDPGRRDRREGSEGRSLWLD